MVGLVYQWEKATITKLGQFQICLNRAQQVATNWFNADYQNSIVQLEDKIIQVISDKGKPLNKLYQPDKRKLLQLVGIPATGSPKISGKHSD